MRSQAEATLLENDWHSACFRTLLPVRVLKIGLSPIYKQSALVSSINDTEVDHNRRTMARVARAERCQLGKDPKQPARSVTPERDAR